MYKFMYMCWFLMEVNTIIIIRRNGMLEFKL